MNKSISLNQENLSQIAETVSCPTYDRSKISAGIVHVGIGGFHRAHQAYYTDELLEKEGIIFKMDQSSESKSDKATESQ